MHRVATRSSARDRAQEPESIKSRKTRRRVKSRRVDSDSESDHPTVTTAVPEVDDRPKAENGVERVLLPDDISREVRKELSEPQIRKDIRPAVRFDDNPVIIPSDPRVDEYDILGDIKSLKANVTFGQLLHDNVNYQKVIREAWTKRRRRGVRLPSVATNYLQVEDHGAPELTVLVDGCAIPKVPVDGGSGVNLMLEDTAFELGYTSFESTDQVLRMADQSRVKPVGRLSQVPTTIGEVTYLLNYVIIRVSAGRPFPMLLGRPWLYMARVLVDWGAKEFVLGKTNQRIPWKMDGYLGETSGSDGYTSDWSDPGEEDSEVFSYFVNQFSETTENDFRFNNPITEQPQLDSELSKPAVMEDRSLGEGSVPLSVDWFRKQVEEGNLPAMGLDPDTLVRVWSAWTDQGEEQESERIKNIVRPSDYEKVEVEPGKTFLLGKSMSKEQRCEYVDLLREYLDVFAWSASDLKGIPPELGQHHIDLVDGSVPVRQRQYRLNPKYSLMVKEEIDSLLKAGFIYPVNNSEWVSPIVVVPKKVGSDGKVKIRVCQDFRKLNAATKKDYFPLPFTDIILDHVAGQECYSFLDGFSGYNQVSIREEDQLKTTFTTEWGTFAFNRMPFGLCNAPGTFQRLMVDIFRDFLRHFLEVFIDDFAVFSKWKEHLQYLRKTFQRCRETGLKLHPGKCFMGMVSGILLGHIVSRNGLEVDSDKVRVILILLAPTNVREVRGFLGCVGYYRRFIIAYARLAAPLTELLKKEEEFLWTDRRQQAFEELKKALASAPILSAPDWSKEFHVTIDASGWCLGAILWQQGEDRTEYPIYYASRQMSLAERKYTTTEREALAVVYACKKFRHYLLGYKIVFHTDHDSLKYLVNKPDLSGRIARWILLLQEFNYEVVVKPGKANANADYLSRLRGPEAVSDINSPFPDEFPDETEVFHISGLEESDYSEIIQYLTQGKYPDGFNREEKMVFQNTVAPFTLIRGVLFRMGPDDQLRRCLEEPERKQVMRALHAGPSGGHFAAVTTINRIRTAGYWWPYIIRDVKNFVGQCDQCQRTGAPSFRNHWPLTPIIPLAPFEKWGIDFIGPINPVTVRKRRYIILATDYATRWVEARATVKNDAPAAATFLFEEIMMRFGHPLELVSDRGKHFLNDVIINITERYLIKHRKTTPYNPKANGLTERANGIVGKILNKMVSAHKTDWDRKLPSAVHAYNTSEKKTMGKSPFFLVFGQSAVHGVELEVETLRVMAARNGTRSEDPGYRMIALQDLDEIRREALRQAVDVQAKRKEIYDKRLPKDNKIEEGGMVLLYDNRHQKFPGKLHTRWMGPYRVAQIFQNGSLQLEDLQGNWLETRVNGSRVKNYNPESFTDPEDSENSAGEEEE